MNSRYFRIAILAVVSAIACQTAWSGEQVDYLKQIKPLIAERCLACHGALKQEGGLRLDTVALAIKGGDRGTAIKPGDAEASLLIQKVTATDESERMPPEGEPLKPEQISALRTW